MRSDMLTTIDEEALEAVSGAGIATTIGTAVDKLLGGALNLLGSTLQYAGSLLSGFGGLLKIG
jgi:hypothetical protein